MTNIDPGKAQAVCHNVFWTKPPVRNIYLSNLEQNTQREQANESDKDKLLTIFTKGKNIQRPCNKVTDKVQPETRTESVWQIYQSNG